MQHHGRHGSRRNKASETPGNGRYARLAEPKLLANDFRNLLGRSSDRRFGAKILTWAARPLFFCHTNPPTASPTALLLPWKNISPILSENPSYFWQTRFRK